MNLCIILNFYIFCIFGGLRFHGATSGAIVLLAVCVCLLSTIAMQPRSAAMTQMPPPAAMPAMDAVEPATTLLYIYMYIYIYI